MSTLIRPRFPPGSDPSRDDDDTGVRALLSALPEPDPMPEQLVARINASLAAEQAQRDATTSGVSVNPTRASVTPIHAADQRRSSRLLFALAGTAAAVALMVVVGSNVFTLDQPTTSTGSAALARTSSPAEAGKAAPPSPSDAGGAAPPSPADAAPEAGLQAPSAARIQIALSGTRYTSAAFVTQARSLRLATFAPLAAGSARVGGAGTAGGLEDCLRGLGATRAQEVRADVGFFEGRPAVIIVATTDGIPMGYAVGRGCSHTDAAVLHPGTPLS